MKHTQNTTDKSSTHKKSAQQKGKWGTSPTKEANKKSSKDREESETSDASTRSVNPYRDVPDYSSKKKSH